MRLHETLSDVITEDGAALAGRIAQREAARKFGGATIKEVAERAELSRATLARIYSGDTTVQDIAVSAMEGLLDMPRDLLNAVRNWDVDWIQQLNTDDRDRQELIRYVMALMERHGRNRSNAS
jgi:AcrR family transcriptional regulator